MTNPVFLEEDCQVTVVPDLTQKNAFPLGSATFGVAVDELAVRLTSTVQGAEAEPQVLLALHRLAGLGSAQAYWPPLFFFFSSALALIGQQAQDQHEQSAIDRKVALNLHKHLTTK